LQFQSSSFYDDNSDMAYSPPSHYAARYEDPGPAVPTYEYAGGGLFPRQDVSHADNARRPTRSLSHGVLLNPDPNELESEGSYSIIEHENSCTTASSEYGAISTHQEVVTEKRKIIIKQISSRVTDAAIQSAIFKAADPYQDYVQGVNIPVDKEHRRKGHAYVTFRSSEVAIHTQKRLNGLRLYGRELEVGLTGEGVVSRGDSDGGPSKYREKTEKRDKERGKTARWSETERSHGFRTSDNYVSREARSPYRDVKAEMTAEPVIADGSNRRRLKSDGKVRMTPRAEMLWLIQVGCTESVV
jgi:hypothetical protein